MIAMAAMAEERKQISLFLVFSAVFGNGCYSRFPEVVVILVCPSQQKSPTGNVGCGPIRRRVDPMRNA